MLSPDERRSPRSADHEREDERTTWWIVGAILGGGCLVLVAACVVLLFALRPVGLVRSKSAPTELELGEAPTPGAELDGSFAGPLHGRVEFPPGTPRDEHAELVLDVPARGGRAAVSMRTPVAADGSFAFRAPLPDESSALRIDAPHLGFTRPIEVPSWAGRDPVRVHPALRACIAVRVELAPDHEALRPWIAGTSVVVSLVQPAQEHVVELDDALEFELRAVDAEFPGATISTSSPFLPPRTSVTDGPRPGTTTRVTLRVDLGCALSGRVVDENGAAVEGVSIAAKPEAFGGWNRGPGRDTTDAQGRFVLLGLAPVDHELRARAPGFATTTLRARAEAASEGLGECVLRLERLGAIRGNVRWRDGSAADGATVFADPTLGAGAEFRTAVADADGVFEFAGLPPGTYVVSARSSESGDVRPDGTVTRGRRGVARVEDVVVDGEPLEIVLGSGLTLEGHVVDERGAPVTSFEIRASPVSGGEVLALPAREVREMLRDEAGRFELGWLLRGTWDVRVTSGPLCSDETWVRMDERTPELLVKLHRAAELRGLVSDERGAPARGVPVWIDRLETVGERNAWMEHSTRSDAEGRFEFVGVERGSVVVHAGERRKPRARPVQVDVPPTGVVDSIRLALQPRVQFEFIVVDEQNVPIEGVDARLRSEWRDSSAFASEWARSDSEGRVRFEDVVAGSYSVQLVHPDRVTSWWMFEIPSVESRAARLRLDRGAPLHVALHGSVEDRTGARVELLDEQDRPWKVYWGRGWRCVEDEVLGGLVRPGAYRIVATAADGRRVQRTLRVANLQPVTVELEFER